MIMSPSNHTLRHFERSKTASSPRASCAEKSLFVFFLLILLASLWTLSFAAPTADLPFGPWTRAANKPILSPQGSTWESAGTFNPAVEFVVPMDNLHESRGSRAIPEIVMLYRAQDASGHLVSVSLKA